MTEQSPLHAEQGPSQLPDIQVISDLIHALTGGKYIEVKIDPNSKDVYFTLDPRPTIVLGMKGSHAEIIRNEAFHTWVGAHEGAHFLQYLGDPQTYEEMFALEKKMAAGDPQLEEVYNRFFNIMLDIHDNALVRGRSPTFQEGERWGNAPSQLYDTLLFRRNDYSTLPHSAQFIDYLIKRMMVPGAEIQLGDLARAAVDRPLIVFGSSYESMESFVQKEIFNPHTSLKQLMSYIKNFVLPVFNELLEADKQEQRLNQQSVEEYFAQPENDLNAADPNTFKEVKEYVRDKNKPASERAEEQRAVQFAKDRTKEGFSETEIQEMLARKGRADTVAQAMKSLWTDLIGKSSAQHLVDVAHQTKGGSIDSPSLIDSVPTLLTEPSRAAIFSSSFVEEGGMEVHPQRIDVYIQLDASGSMFNEDAQRMEAALDTAYAIGQSLILFVQEGRMNNPNFPVGVSLHLVPYGDTAIEAMVADLSAGDGSLSMGDVTKAQQDLWRVTLGLISMGGTHDDQALQKTLERVKKDKEARSDIPPDNILRISLQVTDGGTQTLKNSKTTIQAIKAEGVHARAIQIQQGLTQEERKMFEEEWGDDGKGLEDLGKLKNLAYTLLAQIVVRELQ